MSGAAPAGGEGDERCHARRRRSLPGDTAGPLLIAKGPETGLSVYTSTGHETWVSLGSVTKAQPPIGRKVVVISDDNPAAHDARYGQAAKALQT